MDSSFTSELGKPFPCWNLLSDHVWCGHFSPNASKRPLDARPRLPQTFPFQQWGKASVGGNLSLPTCPRLTCTNRGMGAESEDLHAVHGIPGEDVQGSSEPSTISSILTPILHKRSHWSIATVSLGSGHPLPGHWQTSLVLGVGLSRNLPPPVTHSCADTLTQKAARLSGRAVTGPSSSLTVGLLCASSHMALGILVGLDQQLTRRE